MTARASSRLATHLQWIVSCTDDTTRDSLSSVRRALTKRPPSKPWPCYQPSLDVFEVFSDLFNDILKLKPPSLESVAAAMQNCPMAARLEAFSAVFPEAKEVEKLRKGSGKSYIRAVEKETGCSYLAILRFPFAYAGICDDFCNETLRLLPPTEATLRFGIEVARSQFATKPDPARQSQAASYECLHELERLQKTGVPGLPRPMKEMLLLGCYTGKFAQGTLDSIQWPPARLFLFQDAIVVHLHELKSIRVVRAAESWVVDTSALLGAANPIVEVLSIEESFAFQLADAQELRKFLQKWHVVAGERVPDFGAFSPVSLGFVDTFEWRSPPGICAAE
jgi:hypothetical protein